jgi:hypothetical protein
MVMWTIRQNIGRYSRPQGIAGRKPLALSLDPTIPL